MSFVGDIVDHLDGTSSLVTGTNLFEDYLPDDPVDAVAVIDTGGTGEPTPELVEHYFATFQVFNRGTDKQTGKAVQMAVRNALHGLANIQLGGTYFYYIQLITEGGPTGRDANGNETFSMNFRCRYR